MKILWGKRKTRILWTKYRTADGKRWFCIWRQDKDDNISDACYVEIIN